jgi:uncharacterized protein (DUF2062 family)
MRDWLRRKLPSEEVVRSRPGLRWMGPLLRRPWLWQLNRRRVAIGAGIGVFFGFLIPVAQIAGAAVFALLLRANLPVAAFSTLVSNPFTYAPIGVLAYQTGSWILGREVNPRAAEMIALGPEQAGGQGAGGDWFERVKAIGKPLFLGLAVFAVVGGISAWALVHVAWTIAVQLKRRRRQRAPEPPRAMP